MTKQYIVVIKTFVMADSEQEAIDAIANDLEHLPDSDNRSIDYPFYEIGKAKLSTEECINNG